MYLAQAQENNSLNAQKEKKKKKPSKAFSLFNLNTE